MDTHKIPVTECLININQNIEKTNIFTFEKLIGTSLDVERNKLENHIIHLSLEFYTA